jgi:hypothetical protein
MTKPVPRRRLARLLVPGATSLAVHAGLLAGVLAVTVTVTRPRAIDDRPLGEITVDLGVGASPTPREPASRPSNSTIPPRAAVPQITRAATDAASGASEALRAASAARAAAVAGSRGLSGAPPIGAGVVTTIATNPVEGTSASFAGLSVRAARRIVYAVDASGAMVATLPFVVDELVASIERLDPSQRFGVVLFGGDEVRTPPGPELLRPATPDQKQAVIDWARDAAPRGASDPLRGLEPAIAAEPDLVFFLARSIRRSGPDTRWGAGRSATLRALEDLNPREPLTGRRPSVIKTIQFIDPDPTGLMEAIAGLHGDGAGDTRVITIAELRRLTQPDDQPAETLPDIPAEPLKPDAAAVALSQLASRMRRIEESGLLLRSTYGVLATQPSAVRDLALVDATAGYVLQEIDRSSQLDETDTRVATLAARAAAVQLATERTIETPLTNDHPLAVRLATATTDEDLSSNAGLLRALAHATSARLRGDLPDTERTLERIRSATQFAATPAAFQGEVELEHAVLLGTRLVGEPGIDTRPPRTRPFTDPRTREADPQWTLIHAEAVAHGALVAGAPPERALAPLLALLDRRDLLRTRAERRGLTYPRIAGVVEALTHLRGRASLALAPIEAVLAYATHPFEDPRTLPRDDAVTLLEQLATRAAPTDPVLAGDALIEAARIARDSARNEDVGKARAARLLARAARTAPEHPSAGEAIAAAAEDAADEDADAILTLALDRFAAHPLADAWRVRLAAIRLDETSFALLDGVAGSSDMRAPADLLELAVVDTLLERARDGGARPSSQLLRRSVRIASRLERPDAAARRADLAERLLIETPDEAETIFRSLLAAGFPVPGGPDRLRVGRARALATLGRDTEAAELLSSLVDALPIADAHADPSGHRVFWQANTLWLELVAKNRGDSVNPTISAHITRLRLTDPDLGGEPWRGRLRRLARAVGAPVD